MCWNGHFGQNWLWWPLASREVSSSCMYSVKSMFNCGVGWRPTTVWSLCRIAQTLPTNWRRTSHVTWTQRSRMLWLCLCHRQVQIHCHLQRAPRRKLYRSEGTRGNFVPEGSLQPQPLQTEMLLLWWLPCLLRSPTDLFVLTWSKKEMRGNYQVIRIPRSRAHSGTWKGECLREWVHEELLVQATLPVMKDWTDMRSSFK